MKYITDGMISGLGIDDRSFMQWTEFAIENKNNWMLPPKISIKPTDSIFYNTMPCVMTDVGWAGLKIVTRYPERTPSIDGKILLFDYKTGECVALMDAATITKVRTGAVAAHAIGKLAKPDFKTVSFVGLGEVSKSTMNFMTTLFPQRKMKIQLLRYKDQHQRFIDMFCHNDNLSFEIFEDIDEMASESDVFVSGVTHAETDFCRDESFKEGACVVPIHTRGFTNCDLFFDRIVADDIGHIRNFKNFDKMKDVCEMTDVLNGVKPGRVDDKERIIAYNIGVATQDIYYASKIYDMFSDRIIEDFV